MNDAGGEHVEKHVREADEMVRQGIQDEKHEMCREIQRTHAHADPTRWWFASSAFPMIAGTLGPVASAFSICALVRPWRQRWNPAIAVGDAPYVPDPAWLIIVNAVQLVVALVGNLFLLLNMARRLRFTVAMPFTIVGWYLSAICLVALLTTATGNLILTDPDSEHMWSQAFWYGIYAALLYFVVATLLVVTAWGANKGRYEKDFQLTASQRTLMLQTIMFLMYLLLGALVFSKIEGWQYLDAIYWADVTLFTVGFGDILVTTPLGRGLLFPYALVGVISLGLVIGSIRSLVLERGRRMLDARMIEKKRRRLVRTLTNSGDDEILTPIRHDDGRGAAAGRGDEELDDEGGDGMPPRLRPPRSTKTGLSEIERREKEFRLMRRVQKAAAKRRRWAAMALSSSTWVVLWLVGAYIFKTSEGPYQGWTYFDGVYFCFVSLTTIGYGDLTPVSNPGRSFFVFWSLLALPTMTVLISNAGDTIIKSIRDTTNQLGSITILPGDRGATRDFKAILHTMSCGVLFADDDSIEETPPGFLGEARVRYYPDDGAGYGTEADSSESPKARSEEALADEEAVLEGSSKPRTKGVAYRGEPWAPGGADPATTSKGRDTFRLRGSRAGAVADSSSSSGSTPGASPRIKRAGTVPLSRTNTNGSGRNDSRSQLERRASNSTAPLRPREARTMLVLPPIPSDPIDYHVLLVDEIARVSQHMKQKPARRYSFVEWAWYLRLMGEDEGSAETHRRALPHVHSKAMRRSATMSSSDSASAGAGGGGGLARAQTFGARRLLLLRRAGSGEQEGVGGGGGDAGGGRGKAAENGGGDGSGSSKDTQGSGEAAAGEAKADDSDDSLSGQYGSWSWIGSRSPLMGRQDEAEWIHEKLVMRLADELRGVREERRKRRGEDAT